MNRVLIAPTALVGLQARFVEVLREAGCELVYNPYPTQMTEDELLPMLDGVQAAVAGSEPYSRRVLDANPQLRVIARVGVGYDGVDLAAANDHGMVVTIAAGTNQDAVAEHTFALILALVKDVVPQHTGTCALGWPRKPTLNLRKRTLGVAGLGRIGKEVALRGACFKMRLLAYEPYPDHEFLKRHDITLVSWEELLAESDVLSLHLPATEASRHLINAEALARMKPTAFLVNTSRGSILHEKALIDALQNHRLAGAGLDVFEEEPPCDSPLFRMDNVVVTPHAAGVDLLSRDDMAQSAAESIVALLRGEWPADKIVNPTVKARFQHA